MRATWRSTRVLLLLAALPSGAQAEEWGEECNACPAGARWRPGAEVRIAAPSELLGGGLVYGARDAARVWQAGPCAAPTLVVAPQEETTFERDGQSSIVWMEEPPETGNDEQVLAATCNLCDADGFIVESDIEVFGPAERWNDNCLSPDFSERGVLLHELGHLMGLSHETVDGGAVMYGTVSTARSHRFGSPGESDFRDLCARYGTVSEATVTPVEEGCPAAFGRPGEQCNAQEPQPAGLVCDSEDGSPAWAWTCGDSEPCESGSSCVATGEQMRCLPDLPRRAAAVGDTCASDESCESGLCGEDSRGDRRCLERCGPALDCDGACADVVTGSVYRGRWCIPAAKSQRPAERTVVGCSAGGGSGEQFVAGIALVLLLLRRRAFRLATDRPAP